MTAYRKLIDKWDVANVLGLSVNRIHQLTGAGVLIPVHTFGQTNVYDVDEVKRIRDRRAAGESWAEIGQGS